LPVRQVTKSGLINFKTAKALGLDVTSTLLVLAAELME
jgi:hypothetical protein